MNRLYSWAIVLCFLLSACQVGVSFIEPGIKENGKINIKDRTSIDSLRKNIYVAFVSKKPELVTRLLSSNVKFESLSAIDTMLKGVDVLDSVKLFSFAGEYLVSNSSSSNINEVAGSLSNQSFHFRFVPISSKTYISLFYIPDSYNKNDWLVSCLFAKEEEQWKLYGIRAGYISFDKKIAPYFYDESIHLFREGKIVNAAYRAMLGSQLSNPAKGAFYYDEYETWGEYTKMAIDSFNNLVSIPKVVEEIPSKPILIAMETDVYNGKPCAVIGYKTNLSLSDTTKINNEVDQLHRIVDMIIPGIKETGETIEYRALSASKSKQYMNVHRRFN